MIDFNEIVMAVRRFAIEKGGPIRIEISWQGSWKNGAVSFDGSKVGSFHDIQELKAGREFPLPEGSLLRIQVQRKFLFPELQVSRNGIPLPGSAADPNQLLSGAYGAVFFIAGLSIVAGLLAELGVKFLRQFGHGIHSVVMGIIFLILGFFVLRANRIALGIAVALYIIDTAFYFEGATGRGGIPPIPAILFRFFMLVLMFRGFRAISSLKTPSVPQKMANPPKPMAPSLPMTPPSPAASRPGSISFVAPAVPPTHVRQEPADKTADAERIRIELSRAVQPETDKILRTPGLSARPMRVDIRSKPASADSAASAIRFVAFRCEISDAGIRAVYTNSSERHYPWFEITAVVIRQLPSGPPWEGKILLDLIPTIKPDTPVIPLRLFSTTYVNYSFLPQGHSPSSTENLRRLAGFVAAKNPSVQIEPGTALFVQGGKNAPRFSTIAQFAEYDARYG